MPTIAEKREETINSLLREVRFNIARFEKDLDAETTAANRIPEGMDERRDAEANIADIQRSLAHLREDEAELVKANTDTEDNMAA